MRRVVSALAYALAGVSAVAYPLAVYLGLTRFGARGAGLLLLVVALPVLIYRLGRARSGAAREHLGPILRVPLAVLSVALLSALTDDARVILAFPVIVNGVLLSSFAGSLASVPLIERFARLQDPALSPEKVRYCRSVTKVWCVFFVVNGGVALYLALAASLEAWATYNGGIAYALMGMLGIFEYIVRKYRFRDYSGRLHDRVLAALMPPRS
jgi:uncharacterized membrane protein